MVTSYQFLSVNVSKNKTPQVKMAIDFYVVIGNSEVITTSCTKKLDLNHTKNAYKKNNLQLLSCRPFTVELAIKRKQYSVRSPVEL